MRAWWFVLLLVPLVPVFSAADEPAPMPRLSEVVADPQHDWNGDGRLTASDEYVELQGSPAAAWDLTGWRLVLNDTTPTEWALAGGMAAGELRVLLNPPGEINNHGHIALWDAAGRLVDEVRFGNWPGNAAGVASADARDARDEALRRAAGGWGRAHATPGTANDEPGIFHTPPFEGGTVLWDPGGRNRTWSVRAADADRNLTALRLRLAGTFGEEAHQVPLVPAAGGWTASGQFATPDQDFSYRFCVLDGSGREYPGPIHAVRVDSEPPPVPGVAIPAWTNATRVRVLLDPVADAGIGGVEYLVEAASSDVGPWRVARNWSQDSAPVLLEVPEEALWVRARARDAYAHASNATDPVGTRLDVQPPGAPAEFRTDASRRLGLRWAEVTDNESGLDHWVVRRLAPTPSSWILPAGTTALEDAKPRAGTEVRYDVHAVDRAGNHGPAANLTTVAGGVHPIGHLRTSRTAWGPGVLYVHADFDRPMDAEREPTLFLRGPHDIRLDGGWLRNGTTYAVRLEDSEAIPPGAYHVALESAHDAHGRAMDGVRTRTLRIDRDPPRTRLDPGATTWVNSSVVHVVAEDEADPHPRVTVQMGPPEGETTNLTGFSDVAVRLAGDPVRIRFRAEDDAGNREAWHQRTLRVDRNPPVLSLVRWTREGVEVRAADAASGLDPAGLVLLRPAGGTLEPPTGGGLVRVRLPPGAVDFDLAARDRVGNEAHLALPRPPPGEPLPAPLPAATLPMPEAGAPPHLPPGAWKAAPALAGTPVLLMLPLLLRIRRRRRAPPSLAARLRARRSDTD